MSLPTDNWLDLEPDEDDDTRIPNWRARLSVKPNTPIVRYIQLRTTPQLATALSQAAAAQGISRTQYIRNAVAVALSVSLPEWTFDRCQEHYPRNASHGLPQTTTLGRPKGGALHE